MIFHKHPTSEGFTMIRNGILTDENLSWKAKGLLCYLLSRPETWETRMGHLVTISTDGRVGLRAGMNELEDLGYLKRIYAQGDDAPRLEYHVYDTIPCKAQNLPGGKPACHETAPPLSNTEKKKQEEKKNKRRINTERYIILKREFEKFRLFYHRSGAVVRGLDAELDTFVTKCGSREKAYYTVVLLMPAIQKEDEYRRKCAELDIFVAPRKLLKTWLNQKCWTQEFPNVKSAYEDEPLGDYGKDVAPVKELDPAFPPPEAL